MTSRKEGFDICMTEVLKALKHDRGGGGQKPPKFAGRLLWNCPSICLYCLELELGAQWLVKKDFVEIKWKTDMKQKCLVFTKTATSPSLT